MARIAPSILSADFANLAVEVAKVAPESDLLHVDVMDGHFVPNLTIGPPVVKALRKYTDLYFDCHLMMDNPGDFLDDFKDAGANGCSVHVEVERTRDLIKEMRRLGLDVGLVINPETELGQYEEYLAHIDMIVMMTVNPGFGGQTFMTEVMPKLRATYDLVISRSLDVSIEIDGGIDLTTAPEAARNGGDTFVAGNSIFGASNPREAAGRLREAVDSIAKERR